MADFMRNRNENSKLKQSDIANQLSHSTGTSQRHRSDINLPSRYRIQPNNNNKRSENVSNTNLDNNLHRENDLEGPQVTSNDFVKPDTNTKANKENQKYFER